MINIIQIINNIIAIKYSKFTNITEVIAYNLLLILLHNINNYYAIALHLPFQTSHCV